MAIDDEAPAATGATSEDLGQGSDVNNISAPDAIESALGHARDLVVRFIDEVQRSGWVTPDGRFRRANRGFGSSRQA